MLVNYLVKCYTVDFTVLKLSFWLILRCSRYTYSYDTLRIFIWYAYSLIRYITRIHMIHVLYISTYTCIHMIRVLIDTLRVWYAYSYDTLRVWYVYRTRMNAYHMQKSVKIYASGTVYWKQHSLKLMILHCIRSTVNYYSISHSYMDTTCWNNIHKLLFVILYKRFWRAMLPSMIQRYRLKYFREKMSKTQV
jgi:hypothetical protein